MFVCVFHFIFPRFCGFVCLSFRLWCVYLEGFESVGLCGGWKNQCR
jgi:hypothetical protein